MFRRSPEERERSEAEKRAKAFASSPPGQARVAFERGDLLFQCQFDVMNTRAAVVAMTGAYAHSKTNDPTDILNAIAREGWDIVSASFVFHQTGAESRDKFMASGQQTAVKGSVIGYYVFRRAERRLATADVAQDGHPHRVT